MSWFFSKKKHHRGSPPDTSEEESTSSTKDQSDDYIIIEKQGNPLSPTTPTSGLYPYLGDRTRGLPPLPPSVSAQQQFNAADSQNYINGIPFKLNKVFDNDFEIDSIRVDEIMAFVVRIKNEDYDYDFGLERSIVNEMESEAE